MELDNIARYDWTDVQEEAIGFMQKNVAFACYWKVYDMYDENEASPWSPLVGYDPEGLFVGTEHDKVFDKC